MESGKILTEFENPAIDTAVYDEIQAFMADALTKAVQLPTKEWHKIILLVSNYYYLEPMPGALT
ncbi:MAG: hypothetical protein GY820_19405 [Gammaproteobacteria bacterium]|nr:hypothetical protein [Gammaproteobacteria bacterium]